MTRKNATLIGAGLGLALFLAVALLPTLLYGGYAGVMLAGGIFGTPVTASVGATGLIFLGMVFGAAGMGALFAVGGAAAGAAASALAGVPGTEESAEA